MQMGGGRYRRSLSADGRELRLRWGMSLTDERCGATQ
jgi:hypothetical protein